MSEQQAFQGVIQEGERGGAWVEVPFDVKRVFGSGRPKIRALIDGCEYRGSLFSMGGCYRLGVTKAVRSAIGKDVGDSVEVQVELDTEPRVVDVPPELQATLAANHEAKALYDALSYTHRKEYARWVAEAKQQATRDRRAARAVEMLLEGKRL